VNAPDERATRPLSSDRADLETIFQRAGAELEEIDADEVSIELARFNDRAASAFCVRSGGGRLGEDGLSTVYAFDVQGALVGTWAWSES
jgi:hypothetical protein